MCLGCGSRLSQDMAQLVWTIRQIIDAVKSSPVDLTIRFERVDE